MPIAPKSTEPKKIANSPEFKALQAKVDAAKAILDEVVNAIANLDSKAAPPTDKPPVNIANGNVEEPKPPEDQGIPDFDPKNYPDPVTIRPGSRGRGNYESIKYNDDVTLSRIVELTGK
jgi:hypothetical protein